jgi:hypothetical protein
MCSAMSASARLLDTRLELASPLLTPIRNAISWSCICLSLLVVVISVQQAVLLEQSQVSLDFMFHLLL